MLKFLSSALFRGGLTVQNNAVTPTNLLEVRNNGNIGINQPTDFGYKLDVNGTGRYNGKLTVSAGGAEITGYTLLQSGAGGGLAAVTLNNTLYIWSRMSTASGDGIRLGEMFNGMGGANLNINVVRINTIITGITSGTNTVNAQVIDPTININFGTTTVRGLYYNPTLTSLTGVTHRAIETVTGDVIIGSTSGSLIVGQTANAGYKFDVNGTARISNILTVGSDVATAAVIKNTATDGSLVYAGASFSNASIPVRTIIISTVGIYSGLTGASNLFVGRSAGSTVTSGASNVFIGKSAGTGITTGGANVILSSSDATNLPAALSNSLHLVAGNGYKGNDASSIPSGIHAFMGGGFNSGLAIRNFYFGQMPFTADAGTGLINIAFFAPSGLGTNIGGANFTIVGGSGTGTATGGNVIISTSTPTTSGATLQTVTQRLIVAASTGIVTITNLAGTGSRMMVADATGAVSTQDIPTGSLQGAVDADKNSTASLAVGTTSVKTVSATTYTGVFFDYVVKKGTNVRVGSVVAITNGTDVESYETLSNDIGSTTDLTFTVTLSSGNISLNAVAASTGFTVIVSTRAI